MFFSTWEGVIDVIRCFLKRYRAGAFEPEYAEMYWNTGGFEYYNGTPDLNPQQVYTLMNNGSNGITLNSAFYVLTVLSQARFRPSINFYFIGQI